MDGEVLRRNDDLKVKFQGEVAYFDWPYKKDDDDKDFVKTDKIVDGKRIRQITFATGIGLYNLALYANYETTLFEVNIIFSPFLALPSGWYKGNTHVHANTTAACPNPPHEKRTPIQMAYGGYDCENPPQLNEGYAQKDFDFIFITAHNRMDNYGNLDDLYGYSFKVFKGEEIGRTGQTPKDPHVAGLNISTEIDPPTSGSSLQKITSMDDAVFDQWTVNNPTDSIINHPTFERVDNNALENSVVYHLEIHNNTSSDTGNNTYKDRWKWALNKGTYYSGVASDDAHGYNGIGNAWIVVKSSSSSAKDIITALNLAGWGEDITSYYASTGVVIENYLFNYSSKTLRVEVRTNDNNADEVKFKAKKTNGTYKPNLLTVTDNDSNDKCSEVGLICAEYQINSNIYWIRPVVKDNNQPSPWKAWLQPWHRDFQ